MKTESLTCAVCAAVWTRELKRGRKPRVCADCVERADELEIQPPAHSESAIQFATHAIDVMDCLSSEDQRKVEYITAQILSETRDAADTDGLVTTGKEIVRRGGYPYGIA